MLVNQAVNFASSVRAHTHAPLLREIATRIRARVSPTVVLGKVRGHAGVHGNVQADACAAKGTEDDAPPVPDDGVLPPTGGEGARGGPHVVYTPQEGAKPVPAHELPADEEVTLNDSDAEDAVMDDADDAPAAAQQQ